MPLRKFLLEDESERRAAFEEWGRRYRQELETYYRFIQCVKQYDVDRLKADFSEIGEIVNTADEVNKATALHYAASSGARKVVQWLAARPEIDHLVIDKFNRLPSALAYEVARDPVIGYYLAKKEAAQAEKQGIDLRDFIPS